MDWRPLLIAVQIVAAAVVVTRFLIQVLVVDNDVVFAVMLQ